MEHPRSGCRNGQSVQGDKVMKQAMQRWERQLMAGDDATAEVVRAIAEDMLGSAGFSVRADGTVEVWATKRKMVELERLLLQRES